ncbi:toll/interleukin-1 receptor domain-containing protein [Geodermatophilus sp. SYSU D00965]
MTIKVFVSYSRKDEANVRQLVADLEGARLAVWHDVALSGGDPWWQEILRQIRACDVFLFATSDHAFASKPCRAELGYARDLGLPVLPVQVGHVERLRTSPVADLQVIDYQQPTSAAAIRLLSALGEARAQRRELPDPLPTPPPVPFAYLLRLGSAIEAENLTPVEQGSLIRQLRECLETEEDEGVRGDALDLLRALRQRPDVTYRNAGEIDQVLAEYAGRAVPGPRPPEPEVRERPSVPSGAGQLPPWGGPEQTAPAPPPGYGFPSQPGGPPYTPPHGVPPGPPGGGAYAWHPAPDTRAKRNRLVLLVSAAVAVVVLVVIGAVVLLGGQSDQDRLLAMLPGDFDPDQCRTAAPLGVGEQAAVDCGMPSSLTVAGGNTVGSTFELFADVASVDSAFGEAVVTANGLQPFHTLADCPTTGGWGVYTLDDNQFGNVACFVNPTTSDASIVWTEDEYAALGWVTVYGGGQEALAALGDWWGQGANSDFRR